LQCDAAKCLPTSPHRTESTFVDSAKKRWILRGRDRPSGGDGARDSRCGCARITRRPADSHEVAAQVRPSASALGLPVGHSSAPWITTTTSRGFLMAPNRVLSTAVPGQLAPERGHVRRGRPDSRCSSGCSARRWRADHREGTRRHPWRGATPRARIARRPDRARPTCTANRNRP
jgi:hypothetical protein